MQIIGTADPFFPPEGTEVNGYVFGPPLETMTFWAEQNNCSLVPSISELEDIVEGDESTVTVIDYPGCDSGTEVRHYRVNGGGHAWPGGSFPGGEWPESLLPVNRDINASGEIWNFFARNPHPSLASGDTEAPECTLLGVDPGPPTRLNVRVQDVGSGLASITVVKDKNATVAWEAFAPGTRDAVNVTATKIDERERATVALEVTDLAGHTTTCDPVVTTLSADVPEAFSLEQNYPNPFNPSTQIRFSLAEAGAVRLVVYDVTGREVVRLVDEAMEPGQYEATWEGRDATGRLLSSGVYLYRLEAGPFTQTKSMVLLK
ncbi:MAG: T9SS type A sorting domain-containing protein [Rhodothermales bacterium]